MKEVISEIPEVVQNGNNLSGPEICFRIEHGELLVYFLNSPVLEELPNYHMNRTGFEMLSRSVGWKEGIFHKEE